MSSAGRVLAVDWGRKRFGVALSDPTRLIAQPLTVLTRRPGKRAPVGPVLELARKHDVTEFVVGLPLTSEGEEGEEAREARAFGEALGARSGLKVWFVDERMSTARALRSARETGVSAKAARRRVDAMAAVGILQGWLDARG
ncbi:MAG TPA: Holliday junction resolvase RuvX [Gemmatimonadales bacterium]|nr:Holliday junction resolvase RuvX [Gemmatimonadales bacterium]